jgi:hypothetical protein
VTVTGGGRRVASHYHLDDCAQALYSAVHIFAIHTTVETA